MDTLMIAARALHFASLILLAGTLAFIAFVAAPALARRPTEAIPDGRQLRQLIGTCFALGACSGLIWLVLEARSMSGRSLADALSNGVIAVVLTRTHFGHDWAWRGLLAVPLAVCLILLGARRSRVAEAGFWAALVLSAAELATIADAGHAAAGIGWPGYVQLACDGAHLLAAGAWLGGLVPLALLFAAARRDDGSPVARAAPEVARRFSKMGIVAVGALLATGTVNSVLLVGSVPGLLGTDYGDLLMLKIVLFLVMVMVAAINRQRLTPQLCGGSAPTKREMLRHLQRNTILEAGLGSVILIVVGLLGTTPPALHVQPLWPLPFKLTLAALTTEPERWIETIVAVSIALAGLGLVAYGLARDRRLTTRIFLGMVVLVAAAGWPLHLMVAAAYPTSFYRSTAAMSAPSIMHGARVYADDCRGCHGTTGRGDGPLAKDMPVAPADLTAEHIFGHSEGDLFWWISEGIPEGGMPGFAGSLDEHGRWDVINFVRARAAAVRPLVLLPEVTAGPAAPAPDFVFEQAGGQGTLRQTTETMPVLLVLYQLPGSRPRLDELERAEQRLRTAGLRLLAVQIHGPSATDGEASPPDFAVATDQDTAAAYALFEGAGVASHCEFLVDRAGFLRARWRPESARGLASPGELVAQLQHLAALPLAQEGHAHMH